MKKLISLCLLALALASLAVLAEQDLMTELDTDKDGLISIKEAAENAFLSAMLTELDTNKDVYLSPSELETK
jgi:hypothetical protein